jgi:hypothetical protein
VNEKILQEKSTESSTDKSKLLPCPYCGQAAKYEYGEDWYDITCLCGYTFSHCDKQYPGESTKDAMIRSWNTRRYPPEVVAVIEAAIELNNVPGYKRVALLNAKVKLATAVKAYKEIEAQK